MRGQLITVLTEHTGPVRSASFSPDGSRIVTTSNDNTARLWDDSGEPLAILTGHTNEVLWAELQRGWAATGNDQFGWHSSVVVGIPRVTSIR